MIYLKFTDNDTTDYCKFNLIEECVAFILIESVEDFVISDIPEMDENEYELVTDETYKGFKLS